MIAADTSAVINFLQGKRTQGAKSLDSALALGVVFLPPFVLAELVSSPYLNDYQRSVILRIPVIALPDTFWVEAGDLRRAMYSKNFKVHSMDAFIACLCIQKRIPLITDDNGFKRFDDFGLHLY